MNRKHKEKTNKENNYNKYAMITPVLDDDGIKNYNENLKLRKG